MFQFIYQRQIFYPFPHNRTLGIWCVLLKGGKEKLLLLYKSTLKLSIGIEIVYLYVIPTYIQNLLYMYKKKYIYIYIRNFHELRELGGQWTIETDLVAILFFIS